MDKDELIIKLKPIIATYAQNQLSLADINEHTDFIKDLGINSANLVDIVLDVEETFDIVIDNTSMEKMLTVGAAIDIIKLKLSEKQ